jgi:hypothetical protein
VRIPPLLCKLRSDSVRRTNRHKGSYEGSCANWETFDRVNKHNIWPFDGSEPLDIVVEWNRIGRVVPHTGIAANLRWGLAEYGCCGGLRPHPVGSGRLEGTNEGTERPDQAVADLSTSSLHIEPGPAGAREQVTANASQSTHGATVGEPNQNDSTPA